MSLQRLVRIEEPTLVQCRQFLWDEIDLKKLYSGDGYTVDDDGNRGPMEYLTRQARLDEIEGVVVVDVVPSTGQARAGRDEPDMAEERPTKAPRIGPGPDHGDPGKAARTLD